MFSGLQEKAQDPTVPHANTARLTVAWALEEVLLVWCPSWVNFLGFGPQRQCHCPIAVLLLVAKLVHARLVEVFLWRALRLAGVHLSQQKEPAPSSTCLILQTSLLQAVLQLQLQSHRSYKIVTSDLFLKIQFLNEALLIFSHVTRGKSFKKLLKRKPMAENHQNIPAEPVDFEQRKCQHCVSEEYSSVAIFSAFFSLCCHSKRRQSPIEQCKHPTTSITKYVCIWVPKKKCQVRTK